MLFHENGETKSIMHTNKQGEVVLMLNYDENGDPIFKK